MMEQVRSQVEALRLVVPDDAGCDPHVYNRAINVNRTVDLVLEIIDGAPDPARDRLVRLVCDFADSTPWRESPEWDILKSVVAECRTTNPRS